MKKIVIPVVLLAVAAGVFFYFSRSSVPVTDDYYADYLPPETLATFSLLDLSGLSQSFPASSLGRFFAKPTMHNILSELGAGPEQTGEYDDLYDGVADVMTNPAFKQVFGDDAVVALLPPDPAALKAVPVQEIERSLLVFGTSSVSGPLDSFARLMMSESVSKESVDGTELTRILLDDDEVIYGHAENGIVVLAYEPATLTAALQRKQSGAALQGEGAFAQVKRFWVDTGTGREYGRLFINLARIRTLFADVEEAQVREAADYLQGMSTMGMVINEQEGELQVLTRVEYDFAALHEVIRHQYQSLSRENETLPLLTDTTLLYYWTSILNAAFLRDLLAEAGEEQVRLAEAEVEQKLGIPLDKVLDAIGPQSGMVVREIVNAGLFPLPKVIFFLQIRDHQVVGQILDRLRNKVAGQGYATEQSVEVNGHTIYYWSVLPGEATQPALVLTDSMLYFANGRSSLMDLLTNKPVQGLQTDMAKLLGDGLVQTIKGSNYTTFVLRPARLAGEVREAADWLTGMLTAANGVSAEQLKEEILKIMRSIEVVTATSDIQKDHAVSAFVFKQTAPVEQQ